MNNPTVFRSIVVNVLVDEDDPRLEILDNFEIEVTANDFQEKLQILAESNSTQDIKFEVETY